MSAFCLKIIAMISMFCDHIGYGIYGHFSWLNYIGRLAFPIFAFQISQGYIHTKNLKNYVFRLFIFAFISQVPFMLFYTIFSTPISLNIFFTLLFGLLCIYAYDKNKIIGIIITIISAVIAQFLKFDYGAYGILMIVLFYIFKDKKVLSAISFLILTSIKYLLIPFIKHAFIIQYLYLFIAVNISLIFICLYNNKKGKSLKYFFYLFYPIHLLFVYALHLLF